MTDNLALADNVQSQTNGSAIEAVTPAPVEAPKPARTFTQDEVNELVGHTRKEARERARREFMSESNNFAQQSQSQSYGQQSMGGMSQPSEDMIRDMLRKVAPEVVPNVLREEAYKLQMQQLANDFTGKLESGKGKYSDFEETVAPLDLVKLAPMIPLVNSMDNAVDVIYELGKNPSKAISIMNAIRSELPHLAELEMRKLSASIKQNEEALKQKTANEPFGQIRPSNAGTGNGDLTSSSVRDLRRQSWMKA